MDTKKPVNHKGPRQLPEIFIGIGHIKRRIPGISLFHIRIPTHTARITIFAARRVIAAGDARQDRY